MRKLARQGHCHGILKTKIEFTILGQLQPNGTLRAMNFEKTDAKQAERVHGSADMDFVFASKLQTVRELTGTRSLTEINCFMYCQGLLLKS